MQQLLTGQIRLVGTSEKSIGKTEIVKPTHNKEFEDAVIISAIVNGFDNPPYILGRVKLTKLRYLFDRKRNADVSGYMEKAAGPYDPTVRYSGGEAIAKKNGYIIVTEAKDKGASFSKGQKIDNIQNYIDSWGIRYTIDWLVNDFKYWKTEHLEILATVDNARLKLESSGQEATVQNIVNYILQSPEWKAKRKREVFADEVIEAALEQSKALFN
jgi:type I restriction enzyme S subunit